VLGGLITSRVENREQKVPLAGDIPILGLLFRHQTDTSKRTELLLVLTPHVIRTIDDYREQSVVERDRLVVTPTDVLTSPLMQGLQKAAPEEVPTTGQPAAEPVRLEAPLPPSKEAAPEEYGPPRPSLRPEPPATEPDSYDVPVSMKTGRR
jgi:general secretion pathway protein D